MIKTSRTLIYYFQEVVIFSDVSKWFKIYFYSHNLSPHFTYWNFLKKYIFTVFTHYCGEYLRMVSKIQTKYCSRRITMNSAVFVRFAFSSNCCILFSPTRLHPCHIYEGIITFLLLNTCKSNCLKADLSFVFGLYCGSLCWFFYNSLYCYLTC